MSYIAYLVKPSTTVLAMHRCKQHDAAEPWLPSNCGHGAHGSAKGEMHIMLKNRLPVAGRPAAHRRQEIYSTNSYVETTK